MSYFFFNKKRLCFFYFFRSSTNVLFTWKQVSILQVPIFSYFFSPSCFLTLVRDNFNLVKLLQLKTNDRFCFLKGPTWSAPRFSRAFGSFSKLRSSNSFLKVWLVNLPSGALVRFSVYSSVLLLPSDFYYSFKICRNRSYSAGSSYNLGFRPTVRGIAKNPVDHPHGGRTNSIKSPRTPWGLYARKGK